MHLCSDLKFVYYADDSTATARGSPLETMELHIKQEFGKVDKWICANNISLNASKSSFVIFTNKLNAYIPSLAIQNINIPYKHEVKFLGIILDNKSNFSTYNESIWKKISRSVGAIRKLSLIFPAVILRSLYLSLDNHHVICAIKCRGNSCKAQLFRLNSWLKKSMEINWKLNSRQPLLSVSQIYKYHCLIRFFKYHMHSHSEFFSEKLARLTVAHKTYKIS